MVVVAMGVSVSGDETEGGSSSKEIIKVALIGDSTVTDAAGWGKAFAEAFDSSVVVSNHAAGGRSAKSWLAENRLPAVLEERPNFAFIQFGHNGQPGKGPKRETDPKTTYPEYLKQYVDALKKELANAQQQGMITFQGNIDQIPLGEIVDELLLNAKGHKQLAGSAQKKGAFGGVGGAFKQGMQS